MNPSPALLYMGLFSIFWLGAGSTGLVGSFEMIAGWLAGPPVASAEMAGDPVPVGTLLERRHLAAASRKLRDRASCVEVAARWRGNRARDFARQPDALPFHFRVRDRNRRQQRFGVGVQRRDIQL